MRRAFRSDKLYRNIVVVWKKGSTDNVNNRECIQEINFFSWFFVLMMSEKVCLSFCWHYLELKVHGTPSAELSQSDQCALARSSSTHNRNPLLRIPLSTVSCSFFHGQKHRTAVSWPNSFARLTNCKLQVCDFHSRGFSSSLFFFVSSCKMWAQRFMGKVMRCDEMLKLHSDQIKCTPACYGRGTGCL